MSERRAAGRGRRLDAQDPVVVRDRGPDAVAVGRGDPQRARGDRARRCATGRTARRGTPPGRRSRRRSRRGSRACTRWPSRAPRKTATGAAAQPPRPPSSARTSATGRCLQGAVVAALGDRVRVRPARRRGVGAVQGAGRPAALAQRRHVAVPPAVDRRGADGPAEDVDPQHLAGQRGGVGRPGRGSRCRRCRRTGCRRAEQQGAAVVACPRAGCRSSTGFGVPPRGKRTTRLSVAVDT